MSTGTTKAPATEAVVSEAGPPPHRASMAVSKIAGSVLPPAFMLALFIGAWELVVLVQDISKILLPPPHQIAYLFLDNFSLLARFGRNTASEALQGVAFSCAFAIPIAGASVSVQWLARGLSTYSAVVKAIPVVVLFPVATVFFGVSSPAVIAIVTVTVFPIMFTYALRGFSSNSELDELMRSISAPRFRRFISLTLPQSSPYLMAGLKTAVPISLIVAIVSEYFGGSVTTLGSYIRREAAQLHTPNVWSAILMSTLLSIALYSLVSFLDRIVLYWHPSRHG